jgi:hypothetical protein
MKTRNGFVSNSSSASFIIHWRMRTMGEETNIQKALSNLYELYNYDEEKKDFVWDEYNEEFKDRFEGVMKRTKQNADGSFTTDEFIGMLNDYDDFGKNVQSLVFALVANDCFEIIDARVDRSG